MRINSEKKTCPICGKLETVGILKANNANRYYCADCNIEFFILNNGIVKVYTVTEQGNLELFLTFHKDEIDQVKQEKERQQWTCSNI